MATAGRSGRQWTERRTSYLGPVGHKSSFSLQVSQEVKWLPIAELLKQVPEPALVRSTLAFHIRDVPPARKALHIDSSFSSSTSVSSPHGLPSILPPTLNCVCSVCSHVHACACMYAYVFACACMCQSLVSVFFSHPFIFLKFFKI